MHRRSYRHANRARIRCRRGRRGARRQSDGSGDARDQKTRTTIDDDHLSLSGFHWFPAELGRRRAARTKTFDGGPGTAPSGRGALGALTSRRQRHLLVRPPSAHRTTGDERAVQPESPSPPLLHSPPNAPLNSQSKHLEVITCKGESSMLARMYITRRLCSDIAAYSFWISARSLCRPGGCPRGRSRSARQARPHLHGAQVKHAPAGRLPQRRLRRRSPSHR